MLIRKSHPILSTTSKTLKSLTYRGVTTYFTSIDGMITSQYEIDENGSIANEIIFIYNSDNQLIAFTYNGETYYYLKNHMDDVIAVLDDGGNIIVEYVYDAWGNPYYSKYYGEDDANRIDDINPMLYRSYYYDMELCAYYLQSRYYMPTYHRFLNSDIPEMVRQNKHEYAGRNLFTYCCNNPVNKFDPNGAWGNDVHDGYNPDSENHFYYLDFDGVKEYYGTYYWATIIGYNYSLARALGTYDNFVDEAYASTGPNWKEYDKWHFYTIEGKDVKELPPNPYLWRHHTIVKILECEEYTGCTVNNKTIKKNYRSKNRIRNLKENRLIFEDTQEAIISKSDFEIVQEIRSHKHRITKSGRISIFAGKIYCADCGAKLYYNTSNASERNDFYSCSNYRYNSGTCTAHYIRHVILYNLVFQHIRNVLSYIQQFESTFVKYEIEKENADRRNKILKAKKDIVTFVQRDKDLDSMFKHIYEDMVVGRLNAERFDMLSAEYEQEQKEIRQKISDLQEFIDSGEQELYDLNLFLENVRKYTDPSELTSEMVNELIDKILVHAPDKSSGHRKQKIEIYYKAVGIINIATDDELTAENGRNQWNKQKQSA